MIVIIKYNDIIIMIIIIIIIIILIIIIIIIIIIMIIIIMIIVIVGIVVVDGDDLVVVFIGAFACATLFFFNSTPDFQNLPSLSSLNRLSSVLSDSDQLLRSIRTTLQDSP